MPLARKNDVTNKSARAAKKARGKKVVHDWNVRAIAVQPAGVWEVMVFDGDYPYSQAWLPKTGDVGGLRASLIPDFPTEAEALAAYAAAPAPSAWHIMQAPEWLHGLTYLNLIKLAPTVDYGTDSTATLEPGSEPGQSAPATELGQLS